jgi:hypothetical protein
VGVAKNLELVYRFFWCVTGYACTIEMCPLVAILGAGALHAALVALLDELAAEEAVIAPLLTARLTIRPL